MAKVNNTSSAWTSDTNQQMNTYRASGMPEFSDDVGSHAVTSTNIEVFANDMRVGFIQSFSPSESRTIVKVQELGTEGVVQSVPSNTNGGQMSVSRFAVYNGNLFNALGMTADGKYVDSANYTDGNYKNTTTGTFSNPFKTLKDQRVPIEIRVETKMSGTGTSKYIETYLDCWLSSYSKSVASSTITISEQATIQYSDVTADYVK